MWVKHAYYFKWLVVIFLFTKVRYYILKHHCFIAKWTWLSATCLAEIFFVALKYLKCLQISCYIGWPYLSLPRSSFSLTCIILVISTFTLRYIHLKKNYMVILVICSMFLEPNLSLSHKFKILISLFNEWYHVMF